MSAKRGKVLGLRIVKKLRSLYSEISSSISKIIGAPDFANEIASWDRYLAQRPTSIFDPEQRRRAFPEPLIPFIQELTRRRGQTPELLDVGSGPVSLLAWGLEQNLVQITAVDPLAKAYRKLMRKYRLSYPIQPVEGRGEQLTQLFGEGRFDIVYSSNALDHTMSPRDCLRNMVRVVRVGGVICLEGYVREGTNENWVGLHQHDLVPEGGRLVHYDREGVSTDLTTDLNLTCEHLTIRPFHERSFNSFGHEYFDGKTVTKWYNLEWYTLIFRVQGKVTGRIT